MPLQRFPQGRARTRVVRWWSRRRIFLAAGWYFVILIPTLSLIVLASSVHDLLGVAALVAGVVFGLFAAVWAYLESMTRIELVEWTVRVRGAHLLVRREEGDTDAVGHRAAVRGVHSAAVSLSMPTRWSPNGCPAPTGSTSLSVELRARISST